MTNYEAISIIETDNPDDVTEEDIIAAFQHLIDNGVAWTLQGSYGRAAKALIERGICTPGAA
jgi:hypothetical protein